MGQFTKAALALVIAAMLASTIVAQTGYDCHCDNLWQSPSHGEWYENNPTYHENQDTTGPWEVSTPENQGMDSSLIDAGIDQLRSDKDLSSIILIRHGVIVCEEYFNGGVALDSNNIHSASKSILAVLVCLAIEDGFIDSVDQPIWQLMPGYFQDYDASDRRWDITVEHVMSMTTGLRWQEDSTEYTVGPNDDWVQMVLDQGVSSTPGSQFRYSTGNAHLASAIIHHSVGGSTCCYAGRLFRPLGIDVEHWARDPQGIYSGGCNVYMTPREMARFGQLLLDDGRHEGIQIVPEWAVSACLSEHAVDDATYSYGYMFWIRELQGHTVYIAWGWGGQFIYLIPSLDVLFVSTAYTDGNGSEIDAEGFLKQCVIPSVDNRSAVAKLGEGVTLVEGVAEEEGGSKQWRQERRSGYEKGKVDIQTHPGRDARRSQPARRRRYRPAADRGGSTGRR